MGFKYEKNLKHQEVGINAIVDVFKDVVLTNKKTYSNPTIENYETVFYNIEQIQKRNKIKHEAKLDSDCLILDIKMETGTGKTYTYTKTIFELNYKYGFNKFVVVVPTLPIKAGCEKFLKSEDTKLHFRSFTKYRKKEIKTYIVESIKQKKNKRTHIPHSVSEFVRAENYDQNSIHVLVINSGMINSKTMTKIFDSNLIDTYRTPTEAIKATKPFVIIDEPHKFGINNTTFKKLMNFEPQCIVRYGATFPEDNKKNKMYENLLYDLDAVDAFNLDLVKGINVHIPDGDEFKSSKVTITSIGANNVNFKFTENKTEKTFTLGKGDCMSAIHHSMVGLYIEDIRKSSIILSNGLSLRKKESINPHSYDESLQEIMIQSAIDEHFVLEKKYFQREVKIKPITLFFIDYVESYRSDNPEEEYVRASFESLLKKKITNILNNEDINSDYREYLEQSLKDISQTHGGYHHRDNTSKDEKIIQQVDEILKNKEKLISYKYNDKWNTRRFIFSKWTLKEGWDNPNVFTICKLRSSGSEISKLQEVGRGLRLPVNEYFNRVEIGMDNFDLNYIVDFTEKDFVKKLKSEITRSVNKVEIEFLDDSLLAKLSIKTGESEDNLFDELHSKQIIDRRYKILDYEIFYDYFGEFLDVKKLKKEKVKNSKDKKRSIKVRESNYEKFKDLWEKLNTKVILNYKMEDEKVVRYTIYKFIKEKHTELNVELRPKL